MGSSNLGDTQPIRDLSPAGQPKVLVLAVHPAVRSVLGRVLHEHGYDPLNAASLDEALRLLTTATGSAIILDGKLSG